MMWEEFRDRDWSDDTLPFDMKLPSGRRGELGMNAVAVPLDSSRGARPVCAWVTGKENDRSGEIRTGEYCPDRTDGSLLMLSGDGRDRRSPEFEARRWMGLMILLRDNRGSDSDREGEGGAPPVSDRPSSIM